MRALQQGGGEKNEYHLETLVDRSIGGYDSPSVGEAQGEVSWGGGNIQQQADLQRRHMVRGMLSGNRRSGSRNGRSCRLTASNSD